MTALRLIFLITAPMVLAGQDTDRDKAVSLFQEGAKLDVTGDKASLLEAIERFEASRVLLHRIGEKGAEVTALVRISLIQARLNDAPSAMQTCQNAAAIQRSISGPAGAAAVYEGIARMFHQAREAVSAVLFFERSIPLWHEAGKRLEEAVARGMAGFDYSGAGDKRKALDMYLSAEDLLRGSGRLQDEGAMLDNIGNTYSYLGEPDRAVTYFESALQVVRQIHDKPGEASVLANYAGMFAGLGDYRRALELYQDSLDSLPNGEQWEIRGKVEDELGVTYQKLRQDKTAIPHFQRALEATRKAGDLAGEISTILNLSLLLVDEKDWGQASSLLETIQDKVTEGHNSLAKGQFLLLLGSCREASGDFARARVLYDQAALAMDPRNFPRGHVAALFRLAFLDTREDKLASARGRLEQALSLIEALHGRSNGDELRISVFGSTNQYFDLYTNVLMTMHRADPGKGLDVLAFEANERSRARSLLESLGGPEPESDVARPLRLAQVQSQIGSPDTLLLQFAVGTENSYLWLIGSNSFTSYQLPARTVVENAARAFYDRIHEKSVEASRGLRTLDATVAEQSPEANAEISKMLLGQVVRQIQGKRILVVPDGILQYLPFAALVDPAGMKPLIEKHEIVILPSASVLASIRGRVRNPQAQRKTLAILADPVYSKSDSRLLDSARDPSLPQGSGTFYSRDGALSMDRLPGTFQEAKAIGELLPASEIKVAVGFDANLPAVTAENLGNYRYLHFATHGLVDESRSDRSALVLSLYNRQGQAQPGLLRIGDIVRLSLPAELVVLSACSTGLGEEIRGEGVLNFGRAFLHSGAQRVITSLWSVDDQATSELMTAFYRAVLKDKISPPAALRQAMLHVAADPRWHAPYFWAGFALEGEWK